MDPRERADALLARAKARGKFVVTPDSATSPMDSSNTQQIPRAKIAELDRGQDPETTARVPASLIEENDHPLAGTARTQRLEVPGTRRQPQQTAPPAKPPVTTPLARRPQAEPITSPLKDPSVSGDLDLEDTGLVPTVTKNNGKSDLSRRLDGI